jgi:predicted Ser/Thr protein kinase
MYCAQCGTVVSANSRFCVGCGTPVSDPALSAGTGRLTLSPKGEEELLASVRRALAPEYEVEREIGRGGMAVVFKARDLELERPVALKVLPPELAPVATVAERFKREARLAASLDHPNIIPVYRVGQASGVLYMAMKFIDGRPLDALVADHGPLALPVVLTVLRGAARAIAYAHQHGIVHRDIKGANILIDRGGRVVVSDFGIARAVESATLTATGVMIGTPHFMSPEQCAGKPVGPQSDQYSLGIVAYQLLTGSVPFDGDSLPEILQHHWFTPPPDASLMRPDSPAALTAAVLRMLAKDPAQRFASTDDLVSALDAIPFGPVDRAAGEAGLRALVVPAVTQDASPASPHVAGEGVASGATPRTPDAGMPTAPTAPAADRVGVRGTHEPNAAPTVRAVQPTQPIGAARTANAHSDPALAGHRYQERTVNTAPTVAATKAGTARTPGSGPGAQAPTSNRARRARSPRTTRWRVVTGVIVLIVLVTGVGAVVGARRANSAGLAGGIAGTPRLDALQMRAVGGKAYQDGDYELARRFFVRAVTADPGDRRAQQELGCALLKLGRVDSARAHFVLAHATTEKCP